MTVDDVRAFASRDWTAIGEADSVHWAAEFRERGSEATVAASRALWQHLRSIRPEWPSADATSQDLVDLVRWKRLIDRASHAIADR